ncbi:MAG TPA: hypothetical protein VGC41_23015, partial [Kofleriaceae bacterium]
MAFVALRIVDLRTLVEYSLTLGTLGQFDLLPLTIGSDPSCDLILADAPSRSSFSRVAASIYPYIQRPDDEPERVGTSGFELGPYLIEYSEPETACGGPPPSELGLDFGRRELCDLAAPPAPADPLAQRSRELFARLTHGPRATHLDDAMRAWCEAKLHEHLARLSRTTAPRPPLVPGYIVYKRSLEIAQRHFANAWRYAAIAPVIPSAFAHVHRAMAWVGAHRGRAGSRSPFHHALLHHGIHPVIARTTAAIIAKHFAASSADHDPWEPLVALAERGVSAYALPDAGFVCVIPTLDAAPALDDDKLLERDPAVLADYLEQRGELVHAARVRANQAPTERPRVAPVDQLWPVTGLLLEPARGGKIPPHTATSIPPACLEARSDPARMLPLVAATTELAVEANEIVLDATRPDATLVYDAPVLYLRATPKCQINGNLAPPNTDLPLFDGDELTIGSTTLVVR